MVMTARSRSRLALRMIKITHIMKISYDTSDDTNQTENEMDNNKHNEGN